MTNTTKLPSEVFFHILKANPGKSYTLQSEKAKLFGYEDGVIEVGEKEMLRAKLDLRNYVDGDYCLLSYSPISKTFSTIYDYTDPKILKVDPFTGIALPFEEK